MRTLLSLLTVLLAFLDPATCLATEIHWSPAHDLAPQDQSACFAAADLDGDLDVDISMLVLGPVYHYWNIGTPEVPAWELDLSQFGEIIECHLRAGAFGDLDGDGDLDLVITCLLDQHLRLYENVGTPQTPAWELDPDMFEGLTVMEGGKEPYLADLDADGDLDLFVSMDSGVIKIFMNIGTATSPAWEPAGLMPGVDIGPGASATLAFGDIDGDEDLDLVGITWNSPVQCWENTGTPATYEFVENPAMLSGVESPPFGQGIDLFDIDADGDLDLLISYFLSENFLFLNEGSLVPAESSTWGGVKSLFR